MKRLFVFATLIAVFSAPAFAALTATLGSTPGREGVGGPFEVTIGTDAEPGPTWADYGVTSGFYTFCVEPDNATLLLGSSYGATVDSDVKFGGSNGPLKDLTKQIYAAYLNAGSPVGHTGAVYQEAIWDAEDGLTSSTYIDDVLDGSEDVSGWDRVAVLNLWGGSAENPRDIQSQLVRTGNIVPSPAAVVLGSIGMGLVSWLRRRGSVQ